MTVDTSTLLVAANIFVWFMIVLPIILILIVGVWYVVRRKPSDDEIEEAHQASRENTPRPMDKRGPPTS
ncbi:MAG TPA: hypothetical protein VJT68_00105 [Thermoleophilaceae bacterium]|nr:hypothetical protein [Thermoleophilaceae bacterium]